ncbi:DUF4148 domain-containing protein [Paraburkholderia tropica]|uniref:DUF4148 domain-containing protein n=1 Tax=Paraburkholderia tropica TaxID=92647 RepID=UPI0007EDBD3C|nr:DUF4148 domain-containing protein [Paraburkholderia tropica]OBR50018.1 hypothetical protein A6456_33630 [Paraburkholderia tropica]
MRTLIKHFAIVGSLTLPGLALAQSAEPMTRAEVHTHLVQLEKAGYNPYANDWLYPDNLKRAEASVAQQNTVANAAYGPSLNGTVESGR